MFVSMLVNLPNLTNQSILQMISLLSTEDQLTSLIKLKSLLSTEDSN